MPTLRRLGLLAVLLLAGCGEETLSIEEERIDLRLGGAEVAVVVHQAAEPGLTFVNLHDDENTAVDAALAHIALRGGRLVELRHDGSRNLTFELGDSTYVADPNRIFTDAGRDTTLTRLGAHTPEASAALRAFADSLLAVLRLDELDVVVTVHNNTDENYSVRSYLDDGPYVTDARFAYLEEGSDADDFFFVTDQQIYDGLRARGFNVVLQDNALVTDDGSLSVFAAGFDIPYVNVEAEHGHLEVQREMIEALAETLR